MKFSSLLILPFILMPSVAFSAIDDFSRTLYTGMHGEDVRALQKFLNTDTETRVAISGSGSLGNESDFFGPGTKRALVKFQEKYKEEVLKPFGLISGTGVFGIKTRDKVNALAKQKLSILNQKVTVTPAPIIPKGEVIVMFPSQYSGKAGTMITLSGTGFTATDNTIYFSSKYAVIGATSWNGEAITFRIPNIPKGIYDVFVKNVRGDSNKSAWFVVTDGVTREPKIDSLTPEKIKLGETVLVNGSGFLPEGNIIQYGAGIIKNISSNTGYSITFSPPHNILVATTTNSIKKIELPIWVYVVNENGVSNGKSFILEI